MSEARLDGNTSQVPLGEHRAAMLVAAAGRNGRRAGGHAVVLGASMGGLLAARVLADHFERVTIVERDEFPPIGENRRGVPQGRHVHGLFTHGSAILERLFPGLLEELVGHGAVKRDPGFRDRLIFEGHPAHRVMTGGEGITLSRPLLEGNVRRRVLSLDNVRALEGHAAAGLIAGSDGRLVEGVRVRRARTDGPEESLKADLVVDATGRGSQSPRWLEELGYERPTEERVEVGLRYMTRLYRLRPEHLDGDRAILVSARRSKARAGFAVAIEGLRWMVSLQSYFGEDVPGDEKGFREFAASLAAPDLAELLAVAEPCSEAASSGYPASQHRRYDRMRHFPAGYLVFGDAICSFNPVYGQGMTVAAAEATLLDESLRSSSLDRLAQRFFKAAMKPIEAAWSISAGGDLKFSGVIGNRHAQDRFVNWYMGHVFKAAEADPIVARALLDVVNFQASPPMMMRPRVALRVVWHGLRGKKVRRDEMREALWATARDVLRDVERSGDSAQATAC